MQTALQDPRPILLSKIDINASRVEFSDTPIVLLCGGPVKLKDRPNDPDPPIKSLRHALICAHASYELFRPEEITSWQSDGVFRNLVHFETDLAGICTLVVIILESAGSYTELGAFSQVHELSKKIVAIRSREFNEEPSFINLGILRHLAESHATSVKSYPWNIDRPESISQEVIQDVIDDIQEELGQQPKSQILKPTQNSHVIVLICEIINWFKALKEHELIEYLDFLGISISKEDLRSKLFLLEKFRLIKREVYSDSTFFIRSNENYHRIRLALSEDANPDILRISIECLDYYNKDPKHRKRVRAITQAQRGGSQ